MYVYPGVLIKPLDTCNPVPAIFKFRILHVGPFVTPYPRLIYVFDSKYHRCGYAHVYICTRIRFLLASMRINKVYVCY